MRNRAVLAVALALIAAFTLTACGVSDEEVSRAQDQVAISAENFCSAAARRGDLIRAKTTLSRSLLDYGKILNKADLSVLNNSPSYSAIKASAMATCRDAEVFITQLDRVAEDLQEKIRQQQARAKEDD